MRKFIGEAKFRSSRQQGGNGSASMRREKFVPAADGRTQRWPTGAAIYARRCRHQHQHLVDYRFVKKWLPTTVKTAVVRIATAKAPTISCCACRLALITDSKPVKWWPTTHDGQRALLAQGG